MSALRSFLDWFEGYSDNIEDAPSKKQWGKIVERIERLRAEPDTGPATLNGAAPVAAQPAPPSKPNTDNVEAWWQKTYFAKLEAMGYDTESANEVWALRVKEGGGVDLNADPSAAAQADAGPTGA